MGAVKKMLEEEIPGIHVLSLMVGKSVIEVKKQFKFTVLVPRFSSLPEMTEVEPVKVQFINTKMPKRVRASALICPVQKRCSSQQKQE